MASEEANIKAGLVGEDIGWKYMREHEEREAKVRRLQAEAEELTERAQDHMQAGRYVEAVLAELAAVRLEVRAISVSFQVGASSPEDES